MLSAHSLAPPPTDDVRLELTPLPGHAGPGADLFSSGVAIIVAPPTR